jgi:hypothetical protein
VLHGDEDNDLLSGGIGSDTLYWTSGIDNVYGGADPDAFYVPYFDWTFYTWVHDYNPDEDQVFALYTHPDLSGGIMNGFGNTGLPAPDGPEPIKPGEPINLNGPIPVPLGSS